MKLGARDYLQKPFEVDELLVIARQAIDDQRARLGLRYLLDERDVLGLLSGRPGPGDGRVAGAHGTPVMAGGTRAGRRREVRVSGARR